MARFCLGSSRLGRGVLPNDTLDAPLVLYLVSLEEVVGLGLRGRLGVGVVQQVLDAEQDLLDGNGGLPGLIFVEDGQADGAGRVDVGVEQGRNEFAYIVLASVTAAVRSTRGRSRW
jgi:hypothetical protein